ncbi:MAG: type II secretion system protein GspM [Syntrophomonadaceae bacterium]
MQLSKREKVLLGLLVWLTGIYIFYYYIYEPLNHQVKDLVSDNTRLRAQLMEVRQLEREKDMTNSRYSRCEAELASLTRQVPDSPDVPGVIAFLEETAQKAQTRLNGISYGNKTSENTTRQTEPAMAIPVHFEIMAAGNYYDLLTFLKHVEQAPRLYAFTYVRLVQSAKKQIVADESYLPHGLATDGKESEAAGLHSSDVKMTVNFSSYYHGGRSKEQ